ncbi:MAG TPA: hypothetical protein VF234_01470 [Limnochordia bacterium]
MTEALRVPLADFLDPPPDRLGPLAVAHARPSGDEAISPEALSAEHERRLLLRELASPIADRPMEDIRLALDLLRAIDGRLDRQG